MQNDKNSGEKKNHDGKKTFCIDDDCNDISELTMYNKRNSCVNCNKIIKRKNNYDDDDDHHELIRMKSKFYSRLCTYTLE